jgi:hypothetical protein
MPFRLVLGALAAFLGVAACSGPTLDSLEPSEEAGWNCASVSEVDATASVAIEPLTNASDSPVTVDDVNVATADWEVTDWFVTDFAWSEGGVYTGGFPGPAEEWSSIPPGETALLAMTVRADPESLPSDPQDVSVQYSDGDESGELQMNFGVRLVPAGASCAD